MFVTIYLTIDSRKNRKSKYKKINSDTNSISVDIGLLGTIILAFIAIHLSNFWYKAKFTSEILNDQWGKRYIYYGS